MKVRIDTELCQGHGQCNLACPDVFEFDTQGFARIATPRVPQILESDVERAALGCPERAIEIER